MNVFTLILLGFAIIGIVDKIIGGRLGLSADFDKGMATMGTVAVSLIGIYCIAITGIQQNADAIAEFTEGLPLDPSILIGSILAPDMGGMPIAAGIANTQIVGVFSGVIIASCIGQFVSFQLPVVYPLVDENDKKTVMNGFLIGIVTVPAGLLVGGLALGMPLMTVLLNCSSIALLCALLALGFLKAPAGTAKVLMVFGNIVRVVSYVLFAVVAVGLFVPSLSVVPDKLVHEVLYILIRMTIIVCGGLVLANLVLRFCGHLLHAVAKIFMTNDVAIMGLLLNGINSLAMAPLLREMDNTGQKINAAFAVSGSYILGGQFMFVIGMGGEEMFLPFVASKLTAAWLAVGVVVVSARVKRSQKKNQRG